MALLTWGSSSIFCLLCPHLPFNAAPHAHSLLSPSWDKPATCHQLMKLSGGTGASGNRAWLASRLCLELGSMENVSNAVSAGALDCSVTRSKKIPLLSCDWKTHQIISSLSPAFPREYKSLHLCISFCETASVSCSFPRSLVGVRAFFSAALALWCSLPHISVSDPSSILPSPIPLNLRLFSLLI